VSISGVEKVICIWRGFVSGRGAISKGGRQKMGSFAEGERGIVPGREPHLERGRQETGVVSEGLLKRNLVAATEPENRF
jgi:hypothetical protein